jgi:hypothetical protein
MHRVVCTQHWSRNWRTRAHTGRWSIPAVSHSCRRAIATTGTPHQCCLYPHPKYILVSYVCLLPVPKMLSLKFKSQLIRVVVIVIAVGTVDDNGCSRNGHAILIHMVVWWYAYLVVLVSVAAVRTGVRFASSTAKRPSLCDRQEWKASESCAHRPGPAHVAGTHRQQRTGCSIVSQSCAWVPLARAITTTPHQYCLYPHPKCIAGTN